MSFDAEALIGGGGVAGSAAACLMARAGGRVLLIEREAAAHDKIAPHVPLRLCVSRRE